MAGKRDVGIGKHSVPQVRGTREVEKLRKQLLDGAASGSETTHRVRFTAERLGEGRVRFTAEATDGKRGAWRFFAQKFFGSDDFDEVSGSGPLKGIFVGHLKLPVIRDER
jgi:hypothetical protein